jgi:hypothetical protein
MASGILDKTLERIAEAATRENLYPGLDARVIFVTGTPKHRTDLTRDAVIEAIAIKALDPGQNTEALFCDRLLQGDPCTPGDQIHFQQLDKIVGDAVKAVTEERLLGRKSTTGVEMSSRSR